MTAEEFIQDYNFENDTQYSKYDTNREIMVEFAKYHVEKALKEAEKIGSSIAISKINNLSYWTSVDSNSILESYPLENIK